MAYYARIRRTEIIEGKETIWTGAWIPEDLLPAVVAGVREAHKKLNRNVQLTIEPQSGRR
ncbi:MAG: hypothetical protein O7H41_12110 [Planctomycetota bacterium]|nr:hypothetical protein [Planctomycetota bacterium]